MKWHAKLHWRIIIGLVLGLVYGIVAAIAGWAEFTDDWIVPFGTIFMNFLKFIGVPLVLGSLVTGVASLSDIKTLSRIGGKTIGIYITTTAVAVTIGLVLVNLVRPGDAIPLEVQAELRESYSSDVELGRRAAVGDTRTRAAGPARRPRS